MPKLALHVREQVIELFQQGMRQRSIADKLKISKSGVQYTISKFIKYGTIADLLRTGRPRLYVNRTERVLIRNSMKNPKMTAMELKNDYESVKNLSVSTVKRILRKYGLFGRICARKPRLNMNHVKKRKIWCKLYSKVGQHFWNNVVFTDECKIEMHPRQREYVRRPVNSRYNDKYITKTVKFGGKSIMVWGAIKANGERYLVKCNSVVNSSEYQRILSEGLLPHMSITDIFQQDNAPSHKSQSTMNFIENNKICYISDWPAQSPDLNIIEPVWKLLKDRVSQFNPTSINDLWNICLQEWNKIPNYVIENLFKSVPRRLQAVLRNSGQITKY